MSNGNFGTDSDITNGIYYIEDVADLIALRSAENKGSSESPASVYLSADIDCTDAESVNGLGSWTMTFDGCGHKIYNINEITTGDWGMFGSAAFTIKNLTIESCQITGAKVGLIVASQGRDCSFNNVSVINSSIIATGNAGGFVAESGSMTCPTFSFVQCKSKISFIGTTGQYYGGFVGNIYGYQSAGWHTNYPAHANYNRCVSACSFDNCGTVGGFSARGGYGGAGAKDIYYNCSSRCVFNNCGTTAGIIAGETGENQRFINCKSDCTFNNTTTAIYGLGIGNGFNVCNISTSKITGTAPETVYGGISSSGTVVSTFYDKEVLGATGADEATQGTATANLKSVDWLKAQGFMFGEGGGVSG